MELGRSAMDAMDAMDAAETMAAVEKTDLMETIAAIESALHDLCQPLTVLQCRLELGLLQGSREATYAAAMHGVRECRRMNVAVETIRALLGQQEVKDSLPERT